MNNQSPMRVTFGALDPTAVTIRPTGKPRSFLAKDGGYIRLTPVAYGYMAEHMQHDIPVRITFIPLAEASNL